MRLTFRFSLLAGPLLALALATAPTAQDATNPQPALQLVDDVGQHQGWALLPKITWATTRDDPAINPFLAGEIYMMNTDLTDVERITFTDDAADFFPVLSPTGKRMVFDSNRLRGNGPLNTSDLFLMNPDGSEQTYLVRGSSATWSPDGHKIAYHASASGMGQPIRVDPGSATSDSDIFVLSVDEWLEQGEAPVNLTTSPDFIDDDPDWSPDGTQILFTRHGVNDPHGNSVTAEIHVMNADGSGLTQLTFNTEEERGPDWSPDGARIAFACRRGPPVVPNGPPTAEICVMNADGSSQVQLTFNNAPDLIPTWSLDGTQIVFVRTVSGRQQLFRMNADGTEVTQITDTVGVNTAASQGVVKVAGGKSTALTVSLNNQRPGVRPPWTRSSLFATVVMYTTNALAIRTPLTLRSAALYSGPAWVMLGVILAIAAAGFWMARRAEPA